MTQDDPMLEREVNKTEEVEPLIKFTQYMRPNGRKRETFISVSKKIGETAEQLIKKGYYFEIEELMTGIISMTCEFGYGDNTIIAAHELCTNGPDVVKAVDKLVLDAHTYSLK